mgnify:CR=1 FL=1
MGSRIMHSIIGYKIAEALSIEDKTSFLLGSVAPDAVFSPDGVLPTKSVKHTLSKCPRTKLPNNFKQLYKEWKSNLYRDILKIPKTTFYKLVKEYEAKKKV